MKRLLMLGALLLVIFSLNGCFIFLTNLGSTVEYIARLNGVPGLASMKITINDENGDPKTFNNVTVSAFGTIEWSYNFVVTDTFIAFVEADGDDVFSDNVQVEIRVDDSTKKIVTSFSLPYVATASLTVD